jgi:DNA-directed DNA polymerase
MILTEDFSLQKNKSTILYVDANNLFFRAYHSASSVNGNPLHFLLNMAYSLKSGLPNQYAFAVFDGDNNRQSRLEIFPEYKANREKLKDKNGEEIDVTHLVENAKKIFEVLGFNVYSSNGIEGDDVIGILARKSAEKGLNVIAVSSDKDYRQLCQYSEFLNIYNSQSKSVINQKNFLEKTEIPFDKYVDYLSLTGDSSDGIDGVSKVGEKTAKKWILEVGGIEDIKNNLDKIKNSKTKDNLVEAINNGLLDRNKKLISFHFDKEDTINIDKNKIIKSEINIEKLDEFCITHNMRQFREKYIESLIEMNQYFRNNKLKKLLREKETERLEKNISYSENYTNSNQNKHTDNLEIFLKDNYENTTEKHSKNQRFEPQF